MFVTHARDFLAWACQSLWTTVVQRELAVMGNVVRELVVHPTVEIAACASLPQAIYRALMHSGCTQEAIAEKVGVSASYMSLILTGKRICPARLLLDIVRVTKSAAPLQWMTAQVGAEVYLDEVEAKRARLRAELAELERGRAA